MAATGRPRTIRDIAHLYLSRSSGPVEAPTLNLFVAAQNTDCLSGFHAANLAAALSRRRARVRLFELSGLLPNAAFYFSYHPNVYLRSPGSGQRELHPALDSISITFDSIRLMGEGSATRELRVNLVHIPPVDNGEAFDELLPILRERSSHERWVLYLARDPSPGSRAVFHAALGAAGTFTLSLCRVNGSGPREAAEHHLGHLERWESAVDDRVPTVIRNPNSALSREYLSVCESILGRIDFMRRRRDAEPRFDGWRTGTAGKRDHGQDRPDPV
jgi:hypothetical protein